MWRRGRGNGGGGGGWRGRGGGGGRGGRGGGKTNFKRKRADGDGDGSGDAASVPEDTTNLGGGKYTRIILAAVDGLKDTFRSITAPVPTPTSSTTASTSPSTTASTNATSVVQRGLLPSGPLNIGKLLHCMEQPEQREWQDDLAMYRWSSTFVDVVTRVFVNGRLYIPPLAQICLSYLFAPQDLLRLKLRLYRLLHSCRYASINRYAVFNKRYATQHYVTMKMANRLGGKVRSGEKAACSVTGYVVARCGERGCANYRSANCHVWSHKGEWGMKGTPMFHCSQIDGAAFHNKWTRLLNMLTTVYSSTPATATASSSAAGTACPPELATWLAPRSAWYADDFTATLRSSVLPGPQAEPSVVVASAAAGTAVTTLATVENPGFAAVASGAEDTTEIRLCPLEYYGGSHFKLYTEWLHAWAHVGWWELQRQEMEKQRNTLTTATVTSAFGDDQGDDDDEGGGGGGGGRYGKKRWKSGGYGGGSSGYGRGGGGGGGGGSGRLPRAEWIQQQKQRRAADDHENARRCVPFQPLSDTECICELATLLLMQHFGVRATHVPETSERESYWNAWHDYWLDSSAAKERYYHLLRTIKSAHRVAAHLVPELADPSSSTSTSSSSSSAVAAVEEDDDNGTADS